GGGTAGMTAALYALRNGKTVLVLEQETVGGQISFSPRVENLPSIKQISGSDFSQNLFEQITSLGAEFELEKVERIDKENNIFKVKTDYNTHIAKSVIIAAGVKHRQLGVPMEQELVGKGVSYCAVCDGAFYAGDNVCLIGDANTGVQYAILLANYCKKVYVCTLFDKFFADKRLVTTLLTKENVEIHHNLLLKEFLHDTDLNGLVFENTIDKSLFQIDVKAAFIAVGQMPDNEIFSNLVTLDKNGYIVATEDCTTPTEGVFVAGDCRTKAVRQLATAICDGAIAATAACAYIDK
ncbi:MAG: FAD-dependent oxidoreductase, partial [Clostridia bacterium]